MIRRQESPDRWTCIPNRVLEDRTLSWKARGLLSYILSKPDLWEVRRVDLLAASDCDGPTSLTSAISELVDAGYLIPYRKRNQGSTRFSGQSYNAYDSPISRTPENPDAGKPGRRKTRSPERTLIGIDKRGKTKTGNKRKTQEQEKGTECPPLSSLLIAKPHKREDCAPQGAYSPSFLEFWDAYPNKKGKGAAWKAWQRQGLNGHADAIVASVHAHIVHDEAWQKGFVCHPATYLNQQRWLDEFPAKADDDASWTRIFQEAGYEE